MNIEIDLWYDLQCLPAPVMGSELVLLLEMVNSDGWRVFKKLRGIEARFSACVALNPNTPPVEQQAHRSLWTALAGDLSFDKVLKMEVENAVGVTKEELNFADDDLDEAPLPTIKEFKQQVDKP